MGKIDEFKQFVKKNPKLVKYVKSEESTWQKFYEIYDLYGEDNEAWKEYLDLDVITPAASDLFGWLKTINLDSIQNGVNNLQRVLGVVQDLSSKDDKKTTNEYKPRPMYKHFED
jgi:hypothetical protein